MPTSTEDPALRAGRVPTQDEYDAAVSTLGDAIHAVEQLHHALWPLDPDIRDPRPGVDEIPKLEDIGRLAVFVGDARLNLTTLTREVDKLDCAIMRLDDVRVHPAVKP